MMLALMAAARCAGFLWGILTEYRRAGRQGVGDGEA